MRIFQSTQLHANQADEVYFDRIFGEMEGAGLPEPEYRIVEFMLYATLKNQKWGENQKTPKIPLKLNLLN